MCPQPVAAELSRYAAFPIDQVSKNAMKQLARALAITVVIALVMVARSTTSFAQETHDAAGADEATIRSLEEQGRVGVLNQDPQALRLVWSEHFMVNTPANRVSANREVVLDLMRQGFIHYSSYEKRIEQLRVDGDIAVVMGAETVQPIGKAALAGQTVERRFTHVWKREGERWLLIARHANVVASN